MATTFGSILRRRPLAPLAVSRPDGSAQAVPPPTQSRVPAGTIFGAAQNVGMTRPAPTGAARPGIFGAATQRAGTMVAPARSGVFSDVLRRAMPTAGAPAPAPAPSPLAAPAPSTPATSPASGASGQISYRPTGSAPSPDKWAPGMAAPSGYTVASPGSRSEHLVPTSASAGAVGPGGALPAGAARPTSGAPVLMAPGTAAPAPPASRPGGFGSTIQQITGEERPEQILPGQSATAGLQGSAIEAAQRALNNPSPYDDALFKQEVGRGSEALNADLASRGLDYSSTAGDLFSSRVLQPLLSERARSIGDARQQALAGAQSVIGQGTGLEAEGRGELRGERGYLDDLRERARQQQLQEYQLGEQSFQNTLAQALASGDPGQALAAMQAAGQGMGGPAAQYGQMAGETGAGLQDLAQLFASQFYGRQ